MSSCLHYRATAGQRYFNRIKQKGRRKTASNIILNEPREIYIYILARACIVLHLMQPSKQPGQKGIP